MPKSEQAARNCIVLPMRLREIALNRASILAEIVDDTLDALRTGRRSHEVAELVAASKDHLTEALEEGAEWEYQARVREQAMKILERHRDMTAEQALSLVESTILELAIASSE
jgi:hypothetical protein